MLSCYVAVLNALLLRCSASMRGPSTHTGLLCVRRPGGMQMSVETATRPAASVIFIIELLETTHYQLSSSISSKQSPNTNHQQGSNGEPTLIGNLADKSHESILLCSRGWLQLGAAVHLRCLLKHRGV